MLATTDKWLAGEEVPEDAILENFVKYHHLVRDFDKRGGKLTVSNLSYRFLKNSKNWRLLRILQLD